MYGIEITAYEVAQRFVGIQEIVGQTSNPIILSMLQLDNKWPKDDEVPWCSAFINYIAFLLGLERSKSLLARSWITIGERVAGKIEKKDGSKIFELNRGPKVGMDIVILKRGTGNQPGIENVTAPGHVGFLHEWSYHKNTVGVLGGNQSNTVKVSYYKKKNILTINRLHRERTKTINLKES